MFEYGESLIKIFVTPVMSQIFVLVLSFYSISINFV